MGAAQAAGEGVKQRLSSVDASAAGQQVAASYAAGILAGSDQAVRAAQTLAGRVKAAMAGSGAGSGSRLTHALHDGVTG
jgi:hypothetical protein